MNPLFLLGAAAVATAVMKGKKNGPPEVPPELVGAAAGIARSQIAQGATPEEAAAYAADKIAETGGGFWKEGSRKSGGSMVRF